jgi:hypothetical protein
VPFIRLLGGPRFGRPGLLGTVARTAVIAGTATVTSNAISRHGQQGAAYAEQQEAAARPSQYAAPALYAPPPHDAAPPAAAAGDLIEKLTELARLNDCGALTDAEFTAAKAALLG